ncbi:MAG: hypothetical protein Q9213_001617 [Squamulea squamosa]
MATHLAAPKNVRYLPLLSTHLRKCKVTLILNDLQADVRLLSRKAAVEEIVENLAKLRSLYALERANVAVAINKTLSIFYSPAIFLVKLSVYLLQLRIFGINRTVRYLIYFGIVFQALYGISVIVVLGFDISRCIGMKATLSQFCRTLWKFIIVQAVLNVVTDIYILLLPIGVVWRLQMNRTRRIGVLAVFSTGLL